MDQQLLPFWSVSAADLLARLATTPSGLTNEEAAARVKQFATHRLTPRKRGGAWRILLGQLSSPIVLLLLGATVLSLFLGDVVDAAVILVIVSASALLGFLQERTAAGAVERLLSLVEVKARVMRGGSAVELPLTEVVPGDVVLLSAGATAPGDCLLLEARDLFADEATLTGETFPAEKGVAILPAATPLARRTNAVFLGTHLVSGSATALVTAVGRDTEFGAISGRLRLRPPETDFERGVRRFGYLLMEVTLLLVLAIFAVNVYLHRPALDSLLFSMALAVGLTPQLLPAIVSVNLAHGARRMAEKKVIVKRLAAIENFGSMDVLCTDKTGTITQGVVTLQAALDRSGQPSARALLHASLNAAFETGFASPIDAAIRAHGGVDLSAWKKLDEVPYDFLRKRLSVLAAGPEGNLMITKGALDQVLEVCVEAEDAAGAAVPLEGVRQDVAARFAGYSRDGQRTLGLAYRRMGAEARIGKASEAGMTFLGFLLFADPPKPGVGATVGRLAELGVSLKVVTGDNALVAAAVAQAIGLVDAEVITGRELREMSDGALLQRVNRARIFAEVEPNQKERIVRALRKAGHVVGYLGDGINDASALHAADVGLSVEGAVDVAKEVADIVLLERDLEVLVAGVREGRKTFANTLKYVLMATSANFGNMFSMAGASLLLPFLPLLPKQILLTNLLTDLPEMAIAGDGVDAELLARPRRWDVRFIRNFMLTFGVLSSIFDYLTFGVLLWLVRSTPAQFRTGWLVESVLSAALIALVVRSRRPFFRSRPGRALLLSTLGVAATALALPFLPFTGALGLTPLPPSTLAILVLVVAGYLVSGEVVKRVFYRLAEGARPPPPLDGRPAPTSR
jgi:Mg2+-importing ATPase